ncbi:hypothetical protein DFQ27_004215 [Actinomortierella ambigua]|uniref:Uncharacterized protein n=1 Tax=Actinomortierella ambigua TaxID=1343610 RepID=A0A9P6Q6J9_9FUNG|nr:hypothetical protein DFQ27_004215 [Actinomortierella ambigua]
MLGILALLVGGQEMIPPPIPDGQGDGSGMSNDTQRILLISLSSVGAFLFVSIILCIWIREARANRREMPKSLPPGYDGAGFQEKGKIQEGQTYQQSNVSTGSVLPPYTVAPGAAAAAAAARGGDGGEGQSTGATAAAPPAISTKGLCPITVIVDAPSPTYAPPKTLDKTMMNSRPRTNSTSQPRSGPASFFFSSSSSPSSSSSSSPPSYSSPSSSSSPPSSSKSRDRGVVRSNSKLANLVGMGHNFSGDQDGSLHAVASIEQGRNAGFGLGYDVELAHQYEQQQNKRASAILMEQVLNTPPRSPSPSQMLFGHHGGGESGSSRSSYEYGHGRNPTH